MPIWNDLPPDHPSPPETAADALKHLDKTRDERDLHQRMKWFVRCAASRAERWARNVNPRTRSGP